MNEKKIYHFQTTDKTHLHFQITNKRYLPNHMMKTEL